MTAQLDGLMLDSLAHARRSLEQLLRLARGLPLEEQVEMLVSVQQMFAAIDRLSDVVLRRKDVRTGQGRKER